MVVAQVEQPVDVIGVQGQAFVGAVIAGGTSSVTVNLTGVTATGRVGQIYKTGWSPINSQQTLQYLPLAA